MFACLFNDPPSTKSKPRLIEGGGGRGHTGKIVESDWKLMHIVMYDETARLNLLSLCIRYMVSHVFNIRSLGKKYCTLNIINSILHAWDDTS